MAAMVGITKKPLTEFKDALKTWTSERDLQLLRFHLTADMCALGMPTKQRAELASAKLELVYQRVVELRSASKSSDDGNNYPGPQKSP